jgi:hypothetical protein
MLMHDAFKSLMRRQTVHWVGTLPLLKVTLKRVQGGSEIPTAASGRIILFIASVPYPILRRRRESVTSESVMLMVLICVR